MSTMTQPDLATRLLDDFCGHFEDSRFETGGVKF